MQPLARTTTVRATGPWLLYNLYAGIFVLLKLRSIAVTFTAAPILSVSVG